MPPAGAPGSSSRGRGGKFKKYTRGGGHHFSRDLQPLDAEGNAVSMWSKDRKDGDSDDSEEDEEEDSEEDSDEDEDGEPKDAEATREARKAQKKARKEAAIAKQKSKTVEVGDMPSSDESEEDDDDDMPANPNHSKAARDMAKAAAVPGSGDVEGITEGVASMGAPNRKAREAQEAAAAKEKYMKLHAAGKTDEAKADLERLKVIREQRAAEAARRQAEKEERDEKDKARKAEIEAREAKKREAAAGPKKAGKKK